MIKTSSASAMYSYRYGTLPKPLLRCKTISMACSECMPAALVIHHAMRLCYIVIFVLSDYTIFLRTVPQKARFSRKKIYTGY